MNDQTRSRCEGCAHHRVLTINVSMSVSPIVRAIVATVDDISVQHYLMRVINEHSTYDYLKSYCTRFDLVVDESTRCDLAQVK